MKSPISKIDKILAATVPTWGRNRIINKLAIAKHELAYEAALQTRERHKNLNSPRSSESSRYQSDRNRLITQARELAENSPVVYALLDLIPNYVIGEFHLSPNTGNLNIDSQYQAYWREWSHDCDITGRRDFRTLAELSIRALLRDGDLGHIIVRDGDEIKLQPVEADQIGTPYNTTVRPDYIGGIHIDPKTGRPKQYDIYSRGVETSQYTLQAEVLPSNFIHIFDPKRLDQYRGITCMAACINMLQDLHETIDSEIIAGKFLSSITGIIKSDLGGFDDDTTNILTKTVQDPNSVNRTTNIETIEPGQFRYLSPGEDVQAFMSNRPSPAWQGLVETMIRMSTQCFGFPYEVAYNMGGTGPAVRMHAAQADRTTRRLQKIIESQFIRRCYLTVIAHGIENGRIPEVGTWRNFTCQYPAKPSIDQGRDARADIDLVAAGLLSIPEYYGKMGKDWQIELEESAKAAQTIHKLADKYGVEVTEIRTTPTQEKTAAAEVQAQAQEQVAQIQTQNQGESALHALSAILSRPQASQNITVSLDKLPDTIVNVPEQKQPIVNLSVPEQKPAVVNLAAPEIKIPDIQMPKIEVNIPEQPAPVVNVAPAEVKVEPVINVRIPKQAPPVVNVSPEIKTQPAGEMDIQIERNPNGTIKSAKVK